MINLDVTKSCTGIFSETFRNLPKSQRTYNPFFSYSVIGKEQQQFVTINPLYEWSELSHLGWMEKKNVSFLILGSYPENNPFLHRVEYKNKNYIKYRQSVKFENKVIYNNVKKTHTQYFFNLKKGYKHLNYRNIFNSNNNIDLDIFDVNEFKIYHYKAKTLLNLYEFQIKNNKHFQDGIK